jgi:hypothetical protein
MLLVLLMSIFRAMYQSIILVSQFDDMFYLFIWYLFIKLNPTIQLTFTSIYLNINYIILYLSQF